jgi:hypothetical protein
LLTQAIQRISLGELKSEFAQGELVYEHRDRGILGFAANMSRPLAFLEA